MTAAYLILLSALTMMQSCGDGSSDVQTSVPKTEESSTIAEEQVYTDQYKGIDYGGETYTLAVFSSPGDFPNYAGEERAGFDILSFTEAGEWIYIEVKASKGGMNEPFYMSAAEYLFLQNCLHDGVRYELHRVCFVNDPVNRERIIYSARDVLEKFDCQISNYQFTPKKEVA